MPAWTESYYQSLEDRFNAAVDGLEERLDDIVDGRVAPALEDIPIGSARQLRAAVLFFDIRSFSRRTMSADRESRKESLHLLDAVIPTMTHIVYDHGGYVEKNTGDGIAAIIGAEADDVSAANAALDIATISFYVLKNLVNPYLVANHIDPVNARIGLDLGTLLFARIGSATGTSKYSRNFLTVVGPSANLAAHIQQRAGTDEIWAGDLIKTNAADWRQPFFNDMTPEGWTWTYVGGNKGTYRIWHYDATRKSPGS